MRHLMRMAHRLQQERFDPFDFGGLGQRFLLQFQLQSFQQQRDPVQVLAEIVVQIDANSFAFFFGDVQQFVLEPAALANLPLQLGVGGGQIGGAFLNAFLQLLARFVQRGVLLL